MGRPDLGAQVVGSIALQAAQVESRPPKAARPTACLIGAHLEGEGHAQAPVCPSRSDVSAAPHERGEVVVVEGVPDDLPRVVDAGGVGAVGRAGNVGEEDVDTLVVDEDGAVITTGALSKRYPSGAEAGDHAFLPLGSPIRDPVPGRARKRQVCLNCASTEDHTRSPLFVRPSTRTQPQNTISMIMR